VLLGQLGDKGQRLAEKEIKKKMDEKPQLF
jgi:hypothetical protein